MKFLVNSTYVPLVDVETRSTPDSDEVPLRPGALSRRRGKGFLQAGAQRSGQGRAKRAKVAKLTLFTPWKLPSSSSILYLSSPPMIAM